jgi:3-deoxy-7-phosphoheptulonate synthase
MEQHGDRAADRTLELSKRIADHLLEVQGRVNAQMDASQAELLPEVRRPPSCRSRLRRPRQPEPAGAP